MDIADLQDMLTELKNSLRHVEEKIDKLSDLRTGLIEVEAQVRASAKAISALEESNKSRGERIGEIEREITQLRHAPAVKAQGHWDAVVKQIIAVIVGGVIAFMAAKLMGGGGE